MNIINSIISILKTKYFLIFLLITALGLVFFYTQAKSKKGSDTTEVIELPSAGIPDDFLPFYNKFHEDSLFQMEHIAFPLKGVKVIEETGGGEAHMYIADEWMIHKEFDDMGGTFDRSFEEFAGMVVETIVANGGQFKSVRRFAKLSGEWHLIYYQPMGIY